MKRRNPLAAQDVAEIISYGGSLEIELNRAFNLFCEYHPTIVLTVEDAWSADCVMWAGDGSCPIAKPYDPKDGHGYTSVTTEHQIAGMPIDGWTPAQAVRLAAAMFQIACGEPKEEK